MISPEIFAYASAAGVWILVAINYTRDKKK